MFKMRKLLRNTLIITMISAMMMTSTGMMAFASDEVIKDQAPAVEIQLPEDYVSPVSIVGIDGNAVESDMGYYLNEDNMVSDMTGVLVDYQINNEGILMDAEGNVITALLDDEDNVIKTQLDAEGNMVATLFDNEGNLTDDNGEIVEYTRAYLIDQEGNMIGNNVYVATKAGMIIGAVSGFHMDENKNVVDMDNNIVVAAPEVSEESAEAAEAEEITEAAEEEESEEAEEAEETVEAEEAAAEDTIATIEVPEEEAEPEDIELEEIDINAAPRIRANALGWATTDQGIMYYYDGKNFYQDTRATIDDVEYAFDKDGYVIVNTLFTMGGKKYGATESGEIASGVFKIGSTYYYANTKTKVVKTSAGFVTWNGKKYYVKSNGKLAKSESFKVKKKKYIAGSEANIRAGVFKHGSRYYYANPDTNVVKTSKGWVKYKGNKYYADSNGYLYKNKFKKIDGSKYYFGSNAKMVKSGVFKAADGKYYYAISKNSHIKVTKGFVTSGGKKYYVRSGGKIRTSKQFKVGSKTYTAMSDGHLARGVHTYKGNYYYANSKCRIRTKKALITSNGKKYYIKNGGKLARNTLIKVDGNQYYFGSKAAALTGTFTVGDTIKYTANSSGVITKTQYLDMRGIDVSYAQKSINWKKVKNAGIEFAIIRVGYSGSSSGKCMEDDWFKTNIKGAKEAGLKVGVYYFTTAMTEKQAKAEADFTAKLVKNSGYTLDLPVVIDSEALPGSLSVKGTRGYNYNKLGKTTRTKCVKAFCDQTIANGYTPMIYASTSWLENKLNMKTLDKYQVWVAQYNTRVTYGGKYQCWQYTSSGKVSGITGKVDMNIWYGYDKTGTK